MTTPLKSAPAPSVELEVSGGADLAPTGYVRSVGRTRKSLAEMERDINHYPEPIRANVRWLQGYLLDVCMGNGASLRAIACKAGHDRSESYYYNLLGGFNFKDVSGSWREGGKAWSEFLEIFSAIKRYAEKAAAQGRMEFVETFTYRAIRDYIDRKRALNGVCKFGGIMHPTGSQSSACLKHYCTLNNHGAVIRVEAPAVQRLSILQWKIANRYHITSSRLGRYAERELFIRENVNETRTLIIDNAQNLYIDGRGSNQPMFSWLIELQEDTNCTIILNFTTDFSDKLTAGRAKGYFEQFVGRFGGMRNLLCLTDYAPEQDLRVIAAAFGLADHKKALDFMHRWSREPGRIRCVQELLGHESVETTQIYTHADIRDPRLRTAVDALAAPAPLALPR